MKKKMDDASVRKMVRKGYGQVAVESSCGCGCGSAAPKEISKTFGYSSKEMAEVPEESNLGLGCGNPVALASLKKGEVVMDLGSGAGFDCFLAANRVGKTGKVIGVDMTSEMLDKARANAKKGGYSNVEFRLGEIENLPAADCSVDVIISNCVINLAPDKSKVFREAARVLRKSGRLMVSDIVLTKPLPQKMMRSVGAYIGCISGATMRDDYLKTIEKAGFKSVKVVGESFFGLDYLETDRTIKEAGEGIGMTKKEIEGIARSVLSIKVSAVRK